MGKLPGWAKSKIEEERSSTKPGGPRGRWGGRGGPASFSPLSSEFQPPDDDSQKDPSSLEYPRTPLLVGEDDTSLSEMEHSMSPHPRAQAHGVSFKRPETVDSYNDADVDDYSTQDDGGESTEPESAQGHTMYFGGQEEGSDQYQVG